MGKHVAKLVPTALGLLFIYSGVYKLVQPVLATMALVTLNLPFRLADATIIGVTAVELYLGVILLWKKDLRFGLIVATVLLLTFTGFLWYLSTLAHPPACGCLGLSGLFKSNKANAVFGIFRNCALLWLIRWTYAWHFPGPGDAAALMAAESRGAECPRV